MMLPDTFLIGWCAVMGFVSIFRYFEIRTFYPYTLLWTRLKYPKFKNLTLHLTAMDWATLVTALKILGIVQDSLSIM